MWCDVMQDYDILELRAVYACLPAKFGLDDAGHKAAWRAQFVERLKSMVAQAAGDMVCGGWDPLANDGAGARRRVALAPLTDAQRRHVGYEPTRPPPFTTRARRGVTVTS